MDPGSGRNSWKFLIGVCISIIITEGVSGEWDANFTLQNLWGRLEDDPGRRSLIVCFSDHNHRNIVFTRLLDTGQGISLPKSAQQLWQDPVPSRILLMPGEGKPNRFGAFQCKVDTTSIAALKLPPRNVVELDALSPYTALNINESLILEVNKTRNQSVALRWKHNGVDKPDWNGQSKVQISSVRPSDAGIYECFYQGRRKKGVHALMRVIVRSCPAELYGKLCDKDCPSCYNGGICHDTFGACVCPPGFAGANCEIACGGNRFGAECDKFCVPPKNDSDTDELCAMHLFCKPDPYGCACAPGFKGRLCMDHCSPGWYGANCLQPCHCAYGRSSCNRITGACEGGCATGWRGSSCQEPDADSTGPQVETSTASFCEAGSFGPRCEHRCRCAGGAACHPASGHCPAGCADGWAGAACSGCLGGRYGDRCERRCHCEDGPDHCDKEGFCYSGCESGWGGFTCDQECAAGRFGPNCAYRCHCHQSEPCHKKTGHCPGDCEPGYMGSDCQSLCPSTLYGVNCQEPCVCTNAALCNRFDGSCECNGRWRGATCNESEPHIVTAESVEVNVGNQIYVSCTADGIPDPKMNISCSEFLPEISIRTSTHGQHVAGVKVKPDVPGTYEFLCTARNTHGFDSRKITLYVIDSPVLQSVPVLVSRDNASISVSFKKWEFGGVDKGGSPTDSAEYLVVVRERGSSVWKAGPGWSNQTRASLTDLTPNTEYEVAVRCRRWRKGGEGPAGPILRITTRCGASLQEGIPRNFLTESISETSMTLTWEQPSLEALRCSLTGYHLKYQATETKDKDMFGTLFAESTSKSIAVESLTPNTNYVFRLYPVTALQMSDYYAEIIRRTAEAVPGAVSNLKCQSVKDKGDLLLVSWQSPREDLTGYTLTYTLVDRGQCGQLGSAESSGTRHLHPLDTEITIPNLYPYSTYNVTVRATTAAGEGDAVSALAITAESVPSAAPENVRVISSTNNSLEFAWDRIPCYLANGHITHYQYAVVRVEEESATALGRRRRSASTLDHVFQSIQGLSINIDKLEAFTEYGILVAGATAVGRGKASEFFIHRTGEGVPDAPCNLEAYFRGERKVGLYWEVPKRSNGVITRYRISVQMDSENYLKEVKTLYKAPTKDPLIKSKEEMFVDSLLPNTNYTFMVQAETKAGLGNASVITATTVISVPEEPQELNLVKSELTSLNISWKEPLQKHGAISAYKVSYQATKTLDHAFSIPSTATDREETGDVLDVLLLGLHPSTQYTIRVNSFNDAGWGPAAEIRAWTRTLDAHVSPTLKVLDVEATGETLPIVFTVRGNAPVYKYQVVVVRGVFEGEVDETRLSGFEQSVSRDELPYYIAGQVDPPDRPGPVSFLVGDGETYGGFRNVHLNPGHTYRIRIRTLLLKDEEEKSVLSRPSNGTVGTASVVSVGRKRKTFFGMEPVAFVLIVIGAIVFLIALTFFALLALFYKRQRKKSTNSFSTRDSGLSNSLLWSVYYKPEPSIHDGSRTLPLLEKQRNSLRRSKSDGRISQGIPVEKLEDILANSEIIKKEFQKLDDGQMSPWTIARKTSNIKKNRYGNILPYDRYRVILKPESGKNESDYINASYVDGFRRSKEYIVTQGPLEETVTDFWRMIWQENAPVIVMLTDLVENGKVKCHKYWPDDSVDCGDLRVLLIHSEETRDLVVRTLLIRKTDEMSTHRVVQYHFPGWPDRGVPANVHAFVTLLKKVRDQHPVMAGPVVVHCSAGSGRSGTWVCADALREQATEQRRVDVFRFVNAARHRRVHLVHTLEQYTFIYEALVEATQFENTSILLARIGSYLKEVDCDDRKSFITRQYEKLNRTQKKVNVNRCSAALSEANILKNRDPMTIPGDLARVSLEVDIEEEGVADYINAVYVDGYSKQGAFLVTQMPLTSTVEDFWKLVYQQRSSLILMLNGEDVDAPNVGIYWPESGGTFFGDLQVQLTARQDQKDFIVRVLSICHEDEMEPLKVTQLQYKSWASEMKPASLLKLVDSVEKWYRKSSGGPITIHCMDGAERCGLFIAACNICGQVRGESTVDVFQGVRNIRSNRPEFIPNESQYRLLFEVAEEVAEPFLFEKEENFQPTKKLSFKL